MPAWALHPGFSVRRSTNWAIPAPSQRHDILTCYHLLDGKAPPPWWWWDHVKQTTHRLQTRMLSLTPGHLKLLDGSRHDGNTTPNNTEWFQTKTIIGGSCHKYNFRHDKTQTCVCRDKTHLLSQQKYACCNKIMFVTTKYFRCDKSFVTYIWPPQTPQCQ